MTLPSSITPVVGQSLISDSWQKQNDAFCREAMDLANRLLLGEEKVLLASLRNAFHDHMLWLIPSERRLTLSGGHYDLTLSLSPLASFEDN